jgi:hypothetical protein
MKKLFVVVMLSAGLLFGGCMISVPTTQPLPDQKEMTGKEAQSLVREVVSPGEVPESFKGKCRLNHGVDGTLTLSGSRPAINIFLIERNKRKCEEVGDKQEEKQK